MSIAARCLIRSMPMDSRYCEFVSNLRVRMGMIYPATPILAPPAIRHDSRRRQVTHRVVRFVGMEILQRTKFVRVPSSSTYRLQLVIFILLRVQPGDS